LTSRYASRLFIAAASFSPSHAWTVPIADLLEGQLERQLEVTAQKTVDMLGEGDSFFFKNHAASSDRNIS